MVDAFCATWKLVDSQNFDEYMKALGKIIQYEIRDICLNWEKCCLMLGCTYSTVIVVSYFCLIVLIGIWHNSLLKVQFLVFLGRCWFCHKTSGQCHQTNNSHQSGWGQSGGENPEHLQEHWDLLQTGRGVWRDHAWWPTCQSKLSRSQVVVFSVTCALAVGWPEMAHIIPCLCLQSTFTVEGDKLVQVQKWDGKESKFVREIKDGKMVMVRLNDTHNLPRLTL